MKTRLLVLATLVCFRYVLGLAQSMTIPAGVDLKVTGKPVVMYRGISNCTVKVGRFMFLLENFCALDEGRKIAVIGRVSYKLPGIFWGELWLDKAQIVDFLLAESDEGLAFRLRGMVVDLRTFLVDRYKRSLPEPEAGLLAGIVLGYKKDIGREFYQELVDSGTVHIVVASGYNVLLVAGVVLSVCVLFWRRRTALVVVFLVMTLYGLLAGGEPPVVRAVVMATFLLAGQAIGRGSSGGWFLALAGTLMLLVDPALIASISFQLSMAASFGLLVLEPKLTVWLEKHIEIMSTGLKSIGALTTLSTMAVTLPIIWWNFSRLNLIGILSNILIVPMVAPLMVLGVGTLVVPGWLSVPTYILANLMVRLIYFFG